MLFFSLFFALKYRAPPLLLMDVVMSTVAAAAAAAVEYLPAYKRLSVRLPGLSDLPDLLFLPSRFFFLLGCLPISYRQPNRNNIGRQRPGAAAAAAARRPTDHQLQVA